MAQTKHIRIKGLVKGKGKNASSTPLLNRALMGFLAVLFMLAMLLTIQPVAEKVATQFGVSAGQVRQTAERIASFAGGLLILVVAASITAAPVVAGVLAIGGLIAVAYPLVLWFNEGGIGRGPEN